jgi:hypothetical protein
MRYRLGTLLILMAVLPPLLAGVWFLTRSEKGTVVLALFAMLGAYLIASLLLDPPRIEPPNY